MQHILRYSDSLSGGLIPLTRLADFVATLRVL
jgi:hypothetical protein